MMLRKFSIVVFLLMFVAFIYDPRIVSEVFCFVCVVAGLISAIVLTRKS